MSTNSWMSAPAAPVLQLPPQAATGIDTAVNFSWTPFPGGVHMLDVVPQAGAGSAPEYRIVGAATTAKIPDLSSVGLGLPGATQYSWFLLGFGPFGSIDEAAGPKGLEAPDIVAQSSSRAFTTR